MNLLISYMNDCAFCLTKLIKDFEKEGAKVTAKERSKLKQKDFKNKDDDIEGDECDNNYFQPETVTVV